MSEIIDFRSHQPISRTQAARRQIEGMAEQRRIPPRTRCRAVGGEIIVTVIGAPDARGNHPVRLALADGQVRDFQLPAISLVPIEGERS